MENSDLYHSDFTTASDQEILISKIEEIFYDWELPRISKVNFVGISDYNKGKWLCQRETVNNALVISRYTLDCEDNHDVKTSIYQSQVLDDIVAVENDFCKFNTTENPFTGPHLLTRWYGLRDFVVLSSKNQKNGAILSESQIKTYLSCLNIASDNSNCCVPAFIQKDGSANYYYLGFSRTSKLHTDYEMTVLATKPTYCENVAGLCHLFKSKIGTCSYKKPVTIAVRHTYSRSSWPSDELVSSGGEWLSFTEMGKLPFGSRFNSVNELILTAVWPLLLEQSVVDGDGYSDLDPRNAASWEVTVVPMSNHISLLSDHYNDFLKVAKCESYGPGLLGVDGKSSTDALIPQDVLMTLLYFLFPDADANGILTGMKGAPYDSLPWRLAVVMAHAIYSLGGLPAAEFLWKEFLKELEFRCDNNYIIPGVAGAGPIDEMLYGILNRF